MRSTETDEKAADPQSDPFADFNGLPDENATTEIYKHDTNLAEYEYRLMFSKQRKATCSLPS
jgi:hypothetical protein